MSEMPCLDLAAVAAAVLDDRNRIRRGARRMLAGEPVYCARRHHLQCFVVRTLDGLAVFWRPAEEARMARDVWAEGWAAKMRPTIRVTCNCRVNREIRWADAIG